MLTGNLTLSNGVLRVLVPQSVEEKQKGITDSLGEYQGMLFTDPVGPFVMRNTSIPLTMYFFNEQMEMIDSVDMQPFSVRLVNPPNDCSAALEIPSDEASSYGICKGVKMLGLDVHDGIQKEALTPFQLIGQGSRLSPLRKLMLKAISLSKKVPEKRIFGQAVGGRHLEKTLYNNAEVLPLMALASPLPGPAFLVALPYLAAKSQIKQTAIGIAKQMRKAQYRRAIKNRNWEKIMGMGRQDSRRVLSSLEGKLSPTRRIALEEQKVRSGELSRLLKEIIGEGEQRINRYLRPASSLAQPGRELGERVSAFDTI